MKRGFEDEGLVDVLERLIHHVVLETEGGLVELVLRILFPFQGQLLGRGDAGRKRSG